MLQLQYHNLLLQSILTERLAPDATPVLLDQLISDFDKVTVHVSTPDRDARNKILISLYIKCFNDLERYGAREVLSREYGDLEVNPPESGYDFSILLDVDTLSEDIEIRNALIDKISLIKRNALAGPFEEAFAKFDELNADAKQKGLELYAPEDSKAEVMAIHYRDEESIFIKPSHDRVTVIFSTVFKDETDKVFGKVFLQVCLLYLYFVILEAISN